MTRVRPNNDVETAVLINCGRRCALCVGLNNDHTVKNGQIAHIDRDSSNSSYDNLVFLCIPHHDDYDTVRRQSKNLKPDELRHYKRVVCQRYGPDYSSIRALLSKHQNAILELMNETEHLAVEIDKNRFDEYIILHNDLVSLIHDTFNPDAYKLLDDWHRGLNITLEIINDIYYINSGWRRKFDNRSHSQDILSNKKQQITQSLQVMKTGYAKLRDFLTY